MNPVGSPAALYTTGSPGGFGLLQQTALQAMAADAMVRAAAIRDTNTSTADRLTETVKRSDGNFEA